jgi:hypothetical protein
MKVDRHALKQSVEQTISQVETLVHDQACSRKSGSKIDLHDDLIRRGAVELWLFSLWRERIPRSSQPLFNPPCRPTERNQFVPRVTGHRIESHRTKISANRLVYPSLDLQRMPELQMSVGGVGFEVDRSSIGCLRFRDLPGFL